MNTKLLIIFLILVSAVLWWTYYIGFVKEYPASISQNYKELNLKEQISSIEKISSKIDKDIIFTKPFIYTAPDSIPKSLVEGYSPDFDGDLYINKISVWSMFNSSWEQFYDEVLNNNTNSWTSNNNSSGWLNNSGSVTNSNINDELENYLKLWN